MKPRGRFHDPSVLARLTKDYVIPLKTRRPIAEAISSAGGIAWSELTGDLMLKKIPGLFVAGEMIDWEAPTGGYLLQGCFVTGHRAALGLHQRLSAREAETGLPAQER